MQNPFVSLRIFRLQEWYLQHLPNSYFSYHRLCWLDDGAGMLFYYAGLNQSIPQYNKTGWVLLLDELFLSTFLANNPKYLDLSLFYPTGQYAYIPMSLELAMEMNKLVMDLQQAMQRRKPLEFLQAGVDMMLILIGQAYAGDRDTIRNSWEAEKSRQLTMLMRTHYKTRNDSAFYADQLNVTVKKANLICKSINSRNIGQELNQMRIAESKRLLLLTSMTIKAIAFEMNYETAQHFSTFFSTMTGMSPTEFRKRSRGE